VLGQSPPGVSRNVLLLDLGFCAAHRENAGRPWLAFEHEVVQDATQIGLMSADVLEEGPGQGPERAAPAAAVARSAERRAKRACKQFGGELWNRVWEKTKEILHKLWKMIALLVWVKEWTVQGQAGAALFGLASASVSVTFGS
jgi:hypothetical protein